MKHLTFIAAAVAAITKTVSGNAQLINGNWYGKAVQRIVYTDWGQAGVYNKVMDMSDGQCQTEQVSYSGGMSPLDGEVSWHFRGPMHLKQFAFYTPGFSNATKDAKSRSLQRRHGHGHLNGRAPDVIVATINGDVVSWTTNFHKPANPTTAAGMSSQKPTPTQPATPEINAGAGNWGRQAYYNAANGTADGLVFLNNMGGQGSGVFDYTMGNSLAYASADTKSGSASPEVLKDNLIADNVEVILYTDKPCSKNSCGAYRPGTVAYHGFDGETKLFLMEFDMPLSGKTGFNMDMPAIWMLNAAIPRTEQYGDCSCWKSGCGEWDIFEVLDAGNLRCKSTLHAGKNSGGESDYFTRPTDKTMKAAVIFDGANSAGHIVVLSDDTQFDAVISDDIVAKFGKSSLTDSLTKVFRLGSFTS